MNRVAHRVGPFFRGRERHIGEKVRARERNCDALLCVDERRAAGCARAAEQRDKAAGVRGDAVAAERDAEPEDVGGITDVVGLRRVDLRHRHGSESSRLEIEETR